MDNENPGISTFSSTESPFIVTSVSTRAISRGDHVRLQFSVYIPRFANRGISQTTSLSPFRATASCVFTMLLRTMTTGVLRFLSPTHGREVFHISFRGSGLHISFNTVVSKGFKTQESLFGAGESSLAVLCSKRNQEAHPRCTYNGGVYPSTLMGPMQKIVKETMTCCVQS